jgi:DNA polymerase alpha subunit B
VVWSFCNISFPQPPLTSRDNPRTLELPGAQGFTFGSLGLENLTRPAGGKIESSNGSPFQRVHCVSNPCTFRINEIVVGVTSTDVLLHLSAEEINAQLVPGSRLTRLSQHLVQQQSYYPLFPPSRDVNLNIAQSQYWQLPCQPDLLLLPSKLTSFVRTTCQEQCLIVNPGQLTRNTTGGTYAFLTIYPLPRESLENAGDEDILLPHDIAHRTKVEIRKI